MTLKSTQLNKLTEEEYKEYKALKNVHPWCLSSDKMELLTQYMVRFSKYGAN